MESKLLKGQYDSTPFDQLIVDTWTSEIAARLHIPEKEAGYFVFTGEAVNTTYNPYDEHIKVLFKDGTVSDISKVDNALIHQQVSAPVKKYYLCFMR